MTIPNDHQSGNTIMPMIQPSQGKLIISIGRFLNFILGNIGYNNSYMIPRVHPSLKQQQQGLLTIIYITNLVFLL
jgi:hypothetical protein